MAKQPAYHPFASSITKPKDERANARTTKARKQHSHSKFENRRRIEAYQERQAIEREFVLDY